MTNSNVMRAHEAETRFPLGMRYGNAVVFMGFPVSQVQVRILVQPMKLIHVT